jgi:hypothetical protein
VNCETKLVETDSLNTEVKCICQTLSPVTVVEDLNGLFTNSKVGEVFSLDGASALANMQYYKFVMFYVLVFKTLVFFNMLKKANNLD